MLMILYKFNHATAARGGFGGGADETPKIGPARPPLNPPKRPPEWRCERQRNRSHLISVAKQKRNHQVFVCDFLRDLLEPQVPALITAPYGARRYCSGWRNKRIKQL